MSANVIHQSRTALIWRAGGMIWLISVTLFFASLDLYFAKPKVFLTISIGVSLSAITLILFLWSVKTLGLAKKLPDEQSNADIKRGGNVRKWFLIVLVLEIIGLNVASATLLGFNHFQYIVPVDILIVALHFIPLARIFAMPIYYILGVIMSLIAILTMLLIPASSHAGNLITIAAIPSICFILLNWIAIIYILSDGMKYLRKV